MKIRAVAAAALAVALSAGLAGCNMISPQRTTMQYDASDGVHVDLGDVALRNVLLIADADGKQANLVFTAVNSTTADAKVEIKFDGAVSTADLKFDKTQSATEFGFGDAGENVVMGKFETGSSVTPVFTATYTDAEGATQTVTVDDQQVPVLGDTDADNVLKEYQKLAPAGGDKAPAPTGSAAPAASQPAEGDVPNEEAPVEEAPAE
ncbi:hypothetical protein [Gulosibacter bifidus]|uniref:DNA modification methylase n=1 Tax=Gulosibacter bifidus TaxID=272239 RepID=A0ABW5RHI9_9MICO|nr:hypothetical protein [Gulosibacter bifidus]